MSRCGYSDDIDSWDLIRWRGAVASAIRGMRGQSFLREMLNALDALTEKELIANELIDGKGAVCAIGSVGKARGMDMSRIDYEDPYTVAKAFGISEALAQEIEYINDERTDWDGTLLPQKRFDLVREWILEQLIYEVS